MYRYLPVKPANYNYTLDIPSQVSMPVTGDKNQTVHTFDDQSVAVVTASSQSCFDIVLEWSYISEANKDIIQDLWHNPAKANGRARTFYWRNPIDSRDYTVRFMSELLTTFRPANITEISLLSLRVEGKKP